ncbi:hypothetical protein [Nocardioides marmotae]|uniref:hypothetical protein n=1 Tax=Nocardioides marmotae TaxID=2663857 RepID=UPI0012B5F5EE|nr:hypothetical protein [Nocardioides marmotae]MBC9733287.1 hypothetical protein [Nocardioides marmotae]MTB84397.1 hypothetical protein [Nocardioides marmotae]
MTTNYEQLDWSPLTWALLQGGMALVAVFCMGLAVLMAFRASQATAPAPAATEPPATELPVTELPSAEAPARGRHVAAA